MRYVRFLKTPRIVYDKSSPSAHVSCLITITSDLGDSFLPHRLTLFAELIQHVTIPTDADSEAEWSGTAASSTTNNIRVWKTLQWAEGMRSLPVTLPLSRSCSKTASFVVRIGSEPQSTADEFGKLLCPDTRGVVSVWSSPFTLSNDEYKSKTVERRFQVGHHIHRIIEETGESIARHLWDAGITLSCNLPYLLNNSGTFDQAFEQVRRRQDQHRSAQAEERLQVLELGTGCGIVGITLAHLISKVDVFLTDLPDARAVAVCNILRAKRDHRSSARFGYCEVDWDKHLHERLCREGLEAVDVVSKRKVDLVVAADCTYNADSSPALVKTMQEIASRSPEVTIAIAMKSRHASEDVFFDLMSEAKFQTINMMCLPLPGDEKAGEESVELYLYECSRDPA